MRLLQSEADRIMVVTDEQQQDWFLAPMKVLYYIITVVDKITFSNMTKEFFFQNSSTSFDTLNMPFQNIFEEFIDLIAFIWSISATRINFFSLLSLVDNKDLWIEKEYFFSKLNLLFLISQKLFNILIIEEWNEMRSTKAARWLFFFRFKFLDLN